MLPFTRRSDAPADERAPESASIAGRLRVIGPLAWLAAVSFLSLSIPLTLVARHERSPWILMTSPVERVASTNSLFGYSYLLGSRPFHKENISFVEQVLYFDGAVVAPDLYFARPVYALLASTVAPILGILPALQLLNWVAWGLAAWVAWTFAQRLFADDLTALIAVLLTLGGMGPVSHVGDYSAHLLSFAFYYLGVLLIYDSGVWRHRLPLQTHLGLGACLALACLQYNTGLALALGYVIVSLPRNRWWHVGLAAGIALTAQPVWARLLGLVGSYVTGGPVSFDVYAVERFQLNVSLVAWGRALAHPLAHIYPVLLRLVEFLSFDSPLAVIGGFIGLVVLRKTARVGAIFLLAFIGLPLAGGMAYAFGSGSRGYIVYGISLFFHVALAGLLASLLRRHRAMGLAAAGVVLLTHFAWSTAFLGGNLGPLKAYLLGLNHGWPVLRAGVPAVLSLTGQEPTPIIFGGHTHLASAGLRATPSWEAADVALDRILLTRGLFILYVLLLVGLVSRRAVRARNLLVALTASLILALPALGVRRRPHFDDRIDGAYRLDPGTTLEYSVALSERFRQAILERPDPGFRVLLHLRAFEEDTSAPPPLRLLLGETLLPNRPAGLRLWEIDPRSFVAALSANDRLHLEIAARPSHGVIIGGWQSRLLPGRHLAGPPGLRDAEVLPGLEVRVVNRDGVLRLAAF